MQERASQLRLRGADKRRERRYEVDLPARVTTAAGALIQVQISDVSASGALIIGDPLGDAGALIKLEILGFGTIETRIVHCGKGFSGVEFTDPGRIRDPLSAWLAEEVSDFGSPQNGPAR